MVKWRKPLTHTCSLLTGLLVLTSFCPICSAAYTIMPFLFGSPFNSWALISVSSQRINGEKQLKVEDKKTSPRLLHVKSLHQMEERSELFSHFMNHWQRKQWLTPGPSLLTLPMWPFMSHPWENLYGMLSKIINQGANGSSTSSL